MSITDMLDRTAALENQSREAVIAELKAWNLDEAVAQLRANPAARRQIMARRPGTSAGIMRNSAVCCMLHVACCMLYVACCSGANLWERACTCMA